MIQRSIAPLVAEKLTDSKIVVLRGPRKSGRLTLLSGMIDLSDDKLKVIDCFDKKTRKAIDTVASFNQAISGKSIIVLQEAQLLTQLQAIVDGCFDNDQIENLILLCSFEPQLHEALWEALRFQGLEISLSPISYMESANHFGLAKEAESIEQRLIFGYYPEVLINEAAAESILLEILESSVFTQLGATERINKKEQLIKLLRLLSFNIGKVISFNDLGNQCDLDNETVERYVKLFEKADLLFLLPSYNNGHRYELKKSFIVYFVDNGIRNALIRSFHPFEFRNDSIELWKNWTIAERRKANLLAGRSVESYFWLTHTKQEVDYLEISETGKFGYKMQWDKRKTIKIPSSFQTSYPDIKVVGVNQSSFWTFLQKK
ncbi:MAG: ATP-binding protein [Fluviicola sp.]|nr:ATP-binding protein [Fluviicola sp.]